MTLPLPVDLFNFLIVEDEIIIAETLQEMLFHLGYTKAQRCKTFEKAKEMILSRNFSFAILDINLGGNQEGIELGKLCSEIGLPYFFLTSYSDRNTILEAKESKPGHYVIKPFSPDEIMVAIEMTLLHQSPKEDAKLLKAATVFGLSDREKQILTYIEQRLSNQEIGEKLFLSLNTVKYHLRNIYSKTGASTKQEVIERIEFVWLQKG